MYLPTEDLYIPLGTNNLLEVHIVLSEAKVYYISTIMLAGHELLQCTCSGGSMLWMLSLTVVIVESYKHTIAMDSCCTNLQGVPFSGTKGNMFKAIRAICCCC